MAKESSILGIDLHEQEIRVVQINVRSNKPTLGKIGRAPMPEGSFVNGRILHPGPVAVALRLLLNSMSVGQTGRAVVGVLGDGTSLRTLSVPKVPDSELPTIIAGEVSHYGLVHSSGGSYGYMRLNPYSRSTASESGGGKGSADKRETWLDPEAEDQNPAVVTVVAVEEDVLTSIRDTIEQANLTVEAIEPSQYGMYRSLMLAAGPSATLFALMVSPANTDIAFVHQGVLVGYRRIDIGSRLLTLTYSTTTDSPSTPHSLPGFDEYDKVSSGGSSSDLNRLAAESLSVEIQRTLNYYMREFPDAAIEEHLYLAIDDARIDDLAREFTMALGVTVEPFRPSLVAIDGSESAAQSGSRLGATYAAAFGLAVHGQIMSRIPRLDLFSKQRAGVQQAETQRNFVGSILTSVLAIGLAVGGYFLYHKQIVALEKETADTIALSAKIQADMNTSVQQRHKREEQYKALRDQGVPVTEIMDYISTCVKDRAGLDAVIISPDLKVTIRGQSLSEQLMISTNEALQKCPFLTDMRIYAFRQLPPEQGAGVSFEINGRTVSVGRVRLPEETKKPSPNDLKSNSPTGSIVPAPTGLGGPKATDIDSKPTAGVKIKP